MIIVDMRDLDSIYEALEEADKELDKIRDSIKTIENLLYYARRDLQAIEASAEAYNDKT